MFENCTSLTQAPELPATILVNNCYSDMFAGCTSLTQAPELPATTLAGHCYNEMFQNCTSLSSVLVNFTDWNELNFSTRNWLSGVASTGTFTGPEDLFESNQSRDGSHVPVNWTINQN